MVLNLIDLHNLHILQCLHFFLDAT
jgi:hypothetical protein